MSRGGSVGLRGFKALGVAVQPAMQCTAVWAAARQGAIRQLILVGGR
jgi:hypothetical protein